jgi:hypothetical protein
MLYFPAFRCRQSVADDLVVNAQKFHRSLVAQLLRERGRFDNVGK